MGRNKEFDYEQKLKLAMNLFWEQGYHVTSMSDLEKHMGINRSSIYPTYGDKRDLLIKCLDKYLHHKVLEYKNILTGSQLSPLDQLKTILRLSVDQSINDSRTCLAVKMAFEISPSDKEVVRLLSKNEKMIEEIYYQILEDGQDQGVMKSSLNTRVTAAFLASSSSAFLKNYVLHKNRKEVHDMIETLIKMVQP